MVSYAPYRSLEGVVKDFGENAESWASKQIQQMTARDADWKELGSEPPNTQAESTAVAVLKEAFSLRPLTPSYVTASAEGGVGIVYRSSEKIGNRMPQ